MLFPCSLCVASFRELAGVFEGQCDGLFRAITLQSQL